MKIAYVSDIHMDMFPYVDINEIYVHAWDVLVIAGDSGFMGQLFYMIDELALDFPERKIMVVLGNHEFYMGGTPVIAMERSAKEVMEEYANVHVLVGGECIVHEGVNFIGATLWSDLGSRTSETLYQGLIGDISNGIADFSRIFHGEFSPHDCRGLYDRDRQGIIDSLTQAKQGTTVVVTHFSPHPDFRNMEFEFGPLSYYFSANMDDVIVDYQPEYWISGHTHSNLQEMPIGKTMLLSNQCHETNKSVGIRFIEV